jgi:hypothetical protein
MSGGRARLQVNIHGHLDDVSGQASKPGSERNFTRHLGWTSDPAGTADLRWNITAGLGAVLDEAGTACVGGVPLRTPAKSQAGRARRAPSENSPSISTRSRGGRERRASRENSPDTSARSRDARAQRAAREISPSTSAKSEVKRGRAPAPRLWRPRTPRPGACSDPTHQGSTQKHNIESVWVLTLVLATDQRLAPQIIGRTDSMARGKVNRVLSVENHRAQPRARPFDQRPVGPASSRELIHHQGTLVINGSLIL